MDYWLFENELLPVEVKIVSNFPPLKNFYIAVDESGNLLPAHLSAVSISRSQRLLKRVFDLIGVLVGLGLLWPVMAIVALVIKLDSPGSIFFTQERVGENGRPFRIFKFRSMVQDAEAQLSQLIDIDKLPEPVFKIKNDPRVTRVGRILRRTSLDELPQLFNVLRGEMSLVGPRPEERWLVERYSPEHRQRLRGLPGITGPMQINGRAELSLEERVRLEVDYLTRYSLWQDIKILLKTIPVVITRRGAY